MGVVAVCNEAGRHTGVTVTLSGVYSAPVHASFQCTHVVCAACVCVFMHVVVYNGVTPRSSRAVNEVQRLDVHPSVGTPET